MTFKELKNKIKNEQKELAKEIKALKAKRKESAYGYVEGLEYRRDEYRHTHIAYCQFFNKTPYEKIESSCHEAPRMRNVESHMVVWESKIDEVIRDRAA